MNTAELKQAITQAKKDTGTLVLAHTYQDPDIIDIADITGDSFALSKAAAKMPEAKRVLLCGVRFMADTVKILSPEKEVVLSHRRATCPMAEQIAPERVRTFREENPDVCVCAYIDRFHTGDGSADLRVGHVIGTDCGDSCAYAYKTAADRHADGTDGAVVGIQFLQKAFFPESPQRADQTRVTGTA